MKYEELLEIIRQNNYSLIAIDGRCASGKTTLAARLSSDLDCNIFHMDDFFLPWAQKTRERMDEPGGNVDYERFRNDVMVHLLNKENFSYQPFSCSSQSLIDEVDVSYKKLNIVEGSYSMHPSLIDAYDLKIYVDCDYQTRLERLEKRNPEKMNDFITMWIPLEDRYFDTFSIKDAADAVVEM